MNENIQRVVKEYFDGTINVASNGRIGRYCFFPKKIYKHFKNRLPEKLTIIDIACGAAADHPLMFDYFDKLGIELILIGVDINEKMTDSTKKGLVTYPLEVDLKINNKGKISIEKGMGSYHIKNKAYFPRNLNNLFKRYEDESNTFELIHIDSVINKSSGRWIMKQEYRKRLNFINADATNLPLEDNIADVVIAENFIFGENRGPFKRVNNEIDRILKPGGLYVGDNRKIFS